MQECRMTFDQKWPRVTNNGHGSSIGNGHRGGRYLEGAVLIFTLVLISSKFWPRVASILGLMGGGVAGGREAWQEQIVPWSTPTHESSFLHVLSRKTLKFFSERKKIWSTPTQESSFLHVLAEKHLIFWKDNRNKYDPPQATDLLFFILDAKTFFENHNRNI